MSIDERHTQPQHFAAAVNPCRANRVLHRVLTASIPLGITFATIMREMNAKVQ